MSDDDAIKWSPDELASIEALDREHEAEKEWLRESLATTELKTREGVIVEWMGEGYRKLRGRFAHGLAGIDRKTLMKAHALVALVCRAVKEGDAESLATMAGMTDQLLEMDSKRARYASALVICEDMIGLARKWQGDDLDMRVHGCMLGLVPLVPGVARRIDTEALMAKLVAIASKETSTGNVGRGKEGEQALLIWMLTESGAEPNKDKARDAIKDARRKK